MSTRPREQTVEGTRNMMSTSSKPERVCFQFTLWEAELAGMALEEAWRTEHALRVATSRDFAPSPRAAARAYVLNLLSERSVLFVLYLNGNIISTLFKWVHDYNERE